MYHSTQCIVDRCMVSVQCNVPHAPMYSSGPNHCLYVHGTNCEVGVNIVINFVSIGGRGGRLLQGGLILLILWCMYLLISVVVHVCYYVVNFWYMLTFRAVIWDNFVDCIMLTSSLCSRQTVASMVVDLYYQNIY